MADAETIKPQGVRGLEEYAAADWLERQKITTAIGEVMQARGFMPLETPAIEYGAQIAGAISPSEIFSLTSDKSEDFILRYDLTAPLARYVAANFESLPKPFRRYQVGSVFRNDKPDDGRLRQFTQMDADTINSANPAADAEMVMMLCECLEAAGLAQGDYIVRVNHRKILEQVFAHLNLDPAHRRPVMRVLDKFDRLGEKGVRALLGDGRKDASGAFIAGEKLDEKITEELIGFLKLSTNTTRTTFLQTITARYGESEGTTELAAINALFTELGFDETQIVFDSSIVRGLDYYTGIVFEASLTEGKLGSIGGGGRYNNLLKRFRAEVVPAVGMSVGISRLHFALRQAAAAATAAAADTPAATANLIVILAMEENHMVRYQKLAANLRAVGLEAEVYIGTGAMGKQLKYADKRGARLALIQGEDERTQGVITIKDLQLGEKLAAAVGSRDQWRSGSAAQQQVPEAEIVATCRHLLGHSRKVLNKMADALQQNTPHIEISPDPLQPTASFLDYANRDVRRHFSILTDVEGKTFFLRPDFTLPISIAHAASAPDANTPPNPARYFYQGDIWLWNRKGNQRTQQAQMGIEHIGTGLAHETAASVINATYAGLAAGGVKQPFLRIGNPMLFDHLIDQLNLPNDWRVRLQKLFRRNAGLSLFFQQAQSALRDRVKNTTEIECRSTAELESFLEKNNIQHIGQRSLDEIVERLQEQAASQNPNLPEQTMEIIRNFLRLPDAPPNAAFAQMKDFAQTHDLDFTPVLNQLEAGWAQLSTLPVAKALTPDNVSFSTHFQGTYLNYYTGFVFSFLRGRESGLALAGGGQYDGLMKAMLGISLPSFGATIYLDELFDV